MTTWHFDVGRVRIKGVNAAAVELAALRPLVEHAVRRALETTPLPSGRTMHASVEVRAAMPSSASSIAAAVARGVANAAGGRAHG